jgi:ketosteroid isomerase-like protein
MFRRSIPAVALLVLAACVPKERPINPTENAAISDSVTTAIGEIVTAFGARDVAKLLSYYAPGEVTVAEFGAVYPTRDSLERAANAFWGALRSAAFTQETPRVQVLARNVVVYTVKMSGTTVDTMGTSVNWNIAWTSVWQRLPEGWRIVAEHASAPLPPPSPPSRRR